MSLSMTTAQVAALPWKNVVSSNVLRLAWGGDEPRRVPLAGTDGEAWKSPPDDNLWVDFGTEGAPSVYRYASVPYSHFVACLEAESVGSMVHKIIKGKYRYDEVEIRNDADEQTGLAILEAIERLKTDVGLRLGNIERALSALLASTPPTPHEETHGTKDS
jgi:hypothetical protein